MHARLRAHMNIMHVPALRVYASVHACGQEGEWVGRRAGG